VPPNVFLCLPEVSVSAGSVSASPSRRLRCSLPHARSASAPDTCPIAGLPTLPTHAPVNAARLPLPLGTHDARPVWLAGSSLSETCTLQRAAGFSRCTLTPPVSGGPQDTTVRPGEKACAVGHPLHGEAREVVLQDLTPILTLGTDIRALEFGWPIGMPLCRALWVTVCGKCAAAYRMAALPG
jgi:hypothetical protein